MDGFPLFLILASVMGLSIFLSLPIVYSPRAQGRWAVGLNAGAIGILLFLLADIFANVSLVIYPAGYVANLGYAFAFAVAFVGCFLGLYAVENAPRGSAPAAGPHLGGGPRALATIIALGIALQNLTEGLVFGENWSQGAVGVVAVVFVGFCLQNISEGFPIAAPFLGAPESRAFTTLAGLFLLGGIPTILGGAIGYFWHNNLLLVVFDALALGAIAYVVLPMLRMVFRPLDTREASMRRNRIVYLGVMIGFVIGFAVNAI